MTTRVVRPVITLATAVGVLLAALAVYVFLTAGGARADSTFSPQTTVKFCNDMVNPFPPDPSLNGGAGTCVEGTALNAGANPTITTTLDIPKGDLNFSNIVTLAPNNEAITPGGTDGCAGCIPIGDKIGAVHFDATLGTFNNACLLGIGVDFRLWNVGLPNNKTDPRASTNIVYPQPAGTEDRFGRWGKPFDYQIPVGGGDLVTYSGDGYADDTNNAFQFYPSFLLDAFDPDFVPGWGDNGPAKPLVPLAVYGGLTFVVGEWIPLYLVQFGAGGPTGTATDLTTLTEGPLAKITQQMGQPQVTVLQDPTVAQSPSVITDFCTALNTTTMLLGDSSPGGVPRVTNPAVAGTTQFFLQYIASLRDTDQDGYENQLDTCPIATNVGNPRLANGAANGDADADGIDNACDGLPPNPPATPNPGVTDQDGDGYLNRLDNCPEVANGVDLPTETPPATPYPFQIESEWQYPFASAAPDNGPVPDGIGDPCFGGTISVTQNGRPVSITMSNSVSNGRYMTATNIVAKCIGGTDLDGDGYCYDASLGATFNLDAFDNPATPHAAARHLGWAQFPVATGFPFASAWPFLQMDTDSDRLKDTQETWMSQCDNAIVGQVHTTCGVASPTVVPVILGSDSVHSCAQTIGVAFANDEGPWDNWGYDYNDDGLVNGNDKLTFAKSYTKTVDTGFLSVGIGTGTYDVSIYRFDLNNDGIVNGIDLLALASVYGKTCGIDPPFPTTVPAVPAFSQQ